MYDYVSSIVALAASLAVIAMYIPAALSGASSSRVRDYTVWAAYALIVIWGSRWVMSLVV